MKPIRAVIALILSLALSAGCIFLGVYAVVMFTIPESMGLDGEAEANALADIVLNNDVANSQTYSHTLLRYMMYFLGTVSPEYRDYVNNAKRQDEDGFTYYIYDVIPYSYDYYTELIENELYYENLEYKICLGESDPDYIVKLPGADAGVAYRGGRLYVITDGKETPIKDAPYYYAAFAYTYDIEDMLREYLPDGDICIFSSTEPNKTSSEYSPLYAAMRDLQNIRILLLGALVGVAVTIICIVYTIINRKSLRYAEEGIAKLLSHIFIEFKLAFAVFWTILTISALDNVDDGFLAIVVLALSVIFLIIGIIDLRLNKMQVFLNNIIRCIMLKVAKHQRLAPYVKAERRYALIEVALIVLTVSLGWLGILFMLTDNEAIGLFVVLASLIAFGYIIYRSLERKKVRDGDITLLLERINALGRGESITAKPLSQSSRLDAPYATLGDIENGVRIATENALRSERMKMELITNISHDLKTPLTSIISYVELLSREDGLTDVQRDYISVLDAKSQRLKSLIANLFDLSKAASHNIEVHNDKIDLARLSNQINAELDDKISQAPLNFVVRAPEEPVYIWSDGTLLRRAIENLVTNALKYSLPESRVYIDVLSFEDEAVYMIRNTSAVTIECTADELLARFVRGDNSRTTEGSGLGLSIAESFTELCGGKLDLTVDGDLFKVTLTFPKMGECAAVAE